MFKTETKTITTSHECSFGYAVCDRCGHEMDEADHTSGYNNLALVRFQAGRESKFGEGRHVEGDFCDACLYALLAPYARVIDDSRLPDSDDFFRIHTPRRLFLEHQIAGAMAEGVLMTLGEWIKGCFDPKFIRRPLIEPVTNEPTDASGSKPDAD
ncbi:MAG: hypothetical protein EPN36_02830 [Rhodanobacteraceae bacterium]|nr:MAG: hypothetical protein EPN36_02830 [Rhodanobacteraceae bacterium]